MAVNAGVDGSIMFRFDLNLVARTHDFLFIEIRNKLLGIPVKTFFFVVIEIMNTELVFLYYF